MSTLGLRADSNFWRSLETQLDAVYVYPTTSGPYETRDGSQPFDSQSLSSNPVGVYYVGFGAVSDPQPLNRHRHPEGLDLALRNWSILDKR